MTKQRPDSTGIADRLRDYVVANHRDPDCCGLARMLSEAVEAIRASEAARTQLATERNKTQDGLEMWHAKFLAMCETYLAESEKLAASEAARTQAEQELGWLVENFGPWHDDDCPGDDTCECSAKSHHDAINSLLLEAVHERQAEKERDMTFGEAIAAMKTGQCVQRAGWNGKNMHIYLEDRFSFPIREGVYKGQERHYEPVICMFNAHGKHQPGWLANQPDILADDWQIVTC